MTDHDLAIREDQLESYINRRCAEFGINEPIASVVIQELKSRRIQEAKALATIKKGGAGSSTKRKEISIAQSDPKFLSKQRQHARYAGKLMDKEVDSLYETLLKTLKSYRDEKISEDRLLTKTKMVFRGSVEQAFRLGMKSVGLIAPSGGLRDLTDNENKWIASYLREELKYFKKFVKSVKSGQSDTQLKRRTRMYASAIRSVYESARVLSVGADVIIWWVLESDNPCEDCKTLHRHNPYTTKTLPTTPKAGSTRCFVSAHTMVLTDGGWKRIVDIEIGEYVMTKKGRFKKVLSRYHDTDRRTGENEDYYYNISYYIKPNKNSTSCGRGSFIKHTSVVGDHVFYKNGKEIRADEIKLGMKLDAIGRVCEHCGSIMNFGDSRRINNRYCSTKCKNIGEDSVLSMSEYAGKCDALLSWNKEKKDSSEINDCKKYRYKKAQQLRERRRELRLGKTYEELYGDRADEIMDICVSAGRKGTERLLESGEHIWQKQNGKTFDEIYGKEKSHEIRYKLHLAIDKISYEDKVDRAKKSIKIQRSKGRLFESSIEIMIKELLDLLGIKYIGQWEYKFGFADFFLPDYNIVIEADGDYWHNHPKSTSKDYMSIAYLESKGYRVLRFWERDIRKNIDNVGETIIMHINNHEGAFDRYSVRIINIKKVKINNPRKLYCLEIEDDESFVINGGLISHNCLSNCKCTFKIEKVSKNRVDSINKTHISAEKLLKRIRADRNKRKNKA